MITDDDLLMIEAAAAAATAGPLSLDVRPGGVADITAVVNGSTGVDVMSDDPHGARAVAPGDQRFYLLARQVVPRLADEVRFLRALLADAAALDGAPVAALGRYRQALEDISEGDGSAAERADAALGRGPALTFRHDLDPAATGWHRWPYVCLHGDAEVINGSQAARHGFGAAADDLFLASEPMPAEDGEHHGWLYGRRAVAVLATSPGRLRAGRVALLADAPGLAHARSPRDWR